MVPKILILGLEWELGILHTKKIICLRDREDFPPQACARQTPSSKLVDGRPPTAVGQIIGLACARAQLA